MQYCQTPPPSPCVHVTTVNGPVNAGMNPQQFILSARIGNTLAIQEWTKHWPTALANPNVQNRLQQKAANNDSEVYYTLSATNSGYQLDFYI